MRPYSYLVPLIALLSLSQPSKAELIINIDDATVAVGGSTSINVWISSSNGSDQIQATSFEFQITPIGAGSLEFDDSQGYAAFSSVDYVFHGNSFDELDSSGPYPLGIALGASHERYVGGDESFDYSDLSIPTAPRKLLAILDVKATTAKSGDEFRISLLPSPRTSFHDTNLDSIPFQSSSGTVRVTGPVTVVPEPTSLALLATALPCVIIGFHRTRHRLRLPHA